MARSDHFHTGMSWEESVELINFTPRKPTFTAGCSLLSLAVHVVDHKKRQIPKNRRSHEAHYGRFVIDQKLAGSIEEAKKRALSLPYGASAQTIQVAGFEGRSYALGPVPPPNDPDGRAPAVVVWHEGTHFLLIASTQMDVDQLLEIAVSMYEED